MCNRIIERIYNYIIFTNSYYNTLTKSSSKDTKLQF